MKLHGTRFKTTSKYSHTGFINPKEPAVTLWWPTLDLYVWLILIKSLSDMHQISWCGDHVTGTGNDKNESGQRGNNWTVWRCQVHLYISLTVCEVYRSTSVPVCATVCFSKAFGTTLKRRRRGWLAHCCVRLHTDRPPLMNNYLQQHKTETRSPWCAAGRRFTRTQPGAFLIRASFVLVKAVLWINGAATFHQHPVGMRAACLLENVSTCLLS